MIVRDGAFLAGQLALIAAVLVIWEFGPRIPGITAWAPILDPFFISSPGRIAEKFGTLATTSGDQGVVLPSGNLSVQLWSTLYATVLGFVIGVGSGFLAGLVLSRRPSRPPSCSPISSPSTPCPASYWCR